MIIFKYNRMYGNSFIKIGININRLLRMFKNFKNSFTLLCIIKLLEVTKTAEFTEKLIMEERESRAKDFVNEIST